MEYEIVYISKEEIQVLIDTCIREALADLIDINVTIEPSIEKLPPRTWQIL